MLIPPTPFLIASATISGEIGRGTAQITRSISAGTSSSDRKLVKPRSSIPSISLGSSCTDHTSPVNSCWLVVHWKFGPLSPTTAIVRGLSMRSTRSGSMGIGYSSASTTRASTATAPSG